MRYQFEEFELDTDRFELTKEGSTLKVEPQVMELLQLLIDNRDRMVSKDEINAVVWHGRIVSEAALSSRIKTVRHLLGVLRSDALVSERMNRSNPGTAEVVAANQLVFDLQRD